MGKGKSTFRLRYNAPAVLTFTLLACLVAVLDHLSDGLFAPSFFAAYPDFHFKIPLEYFRLVSHVLGHKDWEHLIANLTFILLVGPMLEEKYGSLAMLKMMLVTALATGILHVLFFSTGLMGASGLVFMMILLASFANYKSGQIPLTFVLVLVVFLAKEFVQSFEVDGISQFAHIVGGLCGSIFGFFNWGTSRK